MTHNVRGVMAQLFTLEELVKSDNSFYYYSICCAQIISVIIIMVGVYYRCPVSTTQVCVFSMLGSALAHIIFPSNVQLKVTWESLGFLVATWVISPFITMLTSFLVYWVIKKVILTGDTKLRALLITPFMSGVVFVIYFSFFFTTDFYMNLQNSTVKVVLVFVILLVGFYIGIVFKRMHFFKTKIALPMRLCTILKHSFSIW